MSYPAAVLAVVALLMQSALVVPSSRVAAQVPPRDSVKPGGGTATVSGRVLDLQTERPLRRMMVRFYARGPASRTFEVLTDDNGRYELRDLPAGEYTATAMPDEHGAAYLMRTYGGGVEPVPFTAQPTLRLQPGETRPDIDFALQRAHAIEGRVVNEYGEPLAELTITPERVDRLGGGRQVSTDDRGQFRVFGLASGTWRVCANAEGFNFDRPTAGQTLQLRYGKTCSAAVTVKDADATGVMLQMQRQRGFTLSGHIVDETGVPIDRPSLSIDRHEREGQFVRSWSVGHPEITRGIFTARGLTPGEYVVRAHVAEPRDQYTSGPTSFRLYGVTPVHIEGSDVTGVVVMLTKGATVRGRIRLEGDPMPPISGVRVAPIRDSDAQRLYSDVYLTPSPVKEDLSFELTRLHGPVLVRAWGTPAGWIVKSVRYGDADVTDVPTEFRGAPSQPIEMTLTNRVARLRVRSADDSGQAVPASIMVGPLDPARWRAGTIYPLAIDTDGSATTTRVPGEYLIVAIRGEDYARQQIRTTEALQAVAARGKSITLKEGEETVVTVPVVKLPELR